MRLNRTLLLLMALVVVLATVGFSPTASASDDLVQNCPAGFELSENQKACLKTTAPVTTELACPEGAVGEPGSCYVVQPRDAAGPAICADQSTPGNNGCLVETQQAVPVCAANTMLVAGTNTCVRFEASTQQQCPDGSQPMNGMCRIVTSAIPMCPDGFEQRGTDCARFETPTQTLVCRDVATDVDGECRRPAPTEGGELACAISSDIRLIDGNCVERVRAARAPALRYRGPFENMPPGPDGGLFGPVYAVAPQPQTRAEARQARRDERAAARAAGRTGQTELAVTGTTSEHLAATAFVLLGTGCGIVGSLRRRVTQ